MIVRRVAALALIAPMPWLATAATAHADFTPGAPGLGDPFFPRAGNGGYDVSKYDIALDYTPKSNLLGGRTRLTATATQDLSSFDLDYRGPRIGSVKLAGAKARFERDGQELAITPAAPIASGTVFTVAVEYRGHPHYVQDPDGSKDGWVQTDDGACVGGEPPGAPTWFPCNDYPTDKAQVSIEVTVPKGL